MKTITLPKVYRALRDDVYEVTVPPDIADRARLAIERMIAVA
jgi:quinolinate synthase